MPFFYRCHAVVPLVDFIVKFFIINLRPYLAVIFLRKDEFRMRKLISKALSSFSRQLFFCILTASILLLIIGLLVLSNYSIRSAIRMNNAKMEENLQVTINNIETSLNEVDYLSYLIFSQNDLLSVASQPYAYPSSTYNVIQQTISRTRISSKNVAEICFCDNWGNLFTTVSGSPLHISDMYTDLKSCREYLASMQDYSIDNNEVWYFLQPNPQLRSRSALVNVREINVGGEDSKPLLLIYFSEEQLSAIYNFLGNGSFIMTPSGKIISSVDKSLIGTSAEEMLVTLSAEKTAASSFVLNGKTYYSAFCPVIHCYLVVPSNSELLQQINRSTMLVTIIILIFGVLFSTIGSKLIAKSMSQSLITLKKKMEQVQAGDLTVRCYTEREDEIGYLCNSFNYMMDMVKRYLDQHDKQHALARKAELQLLQSQINPHLLYNSLDSALCLLNGDHSDQSSKVLEELSQFFRLSLQRGSNIVKVSDAIDLARTYLQLQNLCRMKDYQLFVTGDSTVLDVNILHMCLQPIVENSVLHGLEGNFTDGTIEIQLAKEGNDVLICVKDDGVGMDEFQLAALRAKLDSSELITGGYGLWNVAQRIKMHYGKTYGLEIDSEFGDHTSVTIRIPDSLSSTAEEQPYV